MLLLHGECHPGTVLWSRGKVSGVVDWVGIDSLSANVGHCRVNLAYQVGQEAAERFLATSQDLTGRREYNPYGDILAALGGTDESLEEEPTPSDERFLAQAALQL